MWVQILENVRTILATIGALATIIMAVAALRHRGSSAGTPISSSINPGFPHFPYHRTLDIWEKLLVIDKGILAGVLYGGFTFFLVGLFLLVLALPVSGQSIAILVPSLWFVFLLCTGKCTGQMRPYRPGRS